LPKSFEHFKEALLYKRNPYLGGGPVGVKTKELTMLKDLKKTRMSKREVGIEEIELIQKQQGAKSKYK